MELSKQTIERIENESNEYALGMMGFPHLTKLEHFLDKQMHGDLKRAYHQAATKEALRSQQLVEALNHAVSVIKHYHNCDEVWDIYYNNAPEMKPIKTVLDQTLNKICNG